MSWEEDSNVRFCRRCEKEFSALIRKHHCRGNSKFKFLIYYIVAFLYKYTIYSSKGVEAYTVINVVIVMSNFLSLKKKLELVLVARLEKLQVNEFV